MDPLGELMNAGRGLMQYSGTPKGGTMLSKTYPNPFEERVENLIGALDGIRILSLPGRYRSDVDDAAQSTSSPT